MIIEVYIKGGFIMLNNNMKEKNNSRGTTTHNYIYSCGFRTTRLWAACGEEEFSTSGVFDI
jgi:hypothetical protein